MSRSTPRRRGDRGVTVVIVGISIMMLMTVTALVVDLSLLRNDRRADQKIADAAATAGALALATGNGKDACIQARAHLEANTPEVTSFSGLDCSGFVDFCDPSTAPVSTTGTAGPYRVQIVHPVPDAHPLMARASAIGAPAAPTLAVDGSNCERVGVSVEYTRPPAFAGVIDGEDDTTSVHAVAKTASVTGGYRPINLLILERYDCRAIAAEGQAQLKVGAITGHSGELLPGILAVDSSAVNPDGTYGADCGTASSPNVGTLHAQGSDALVQADGPPNCPAELVAGTGEGCGFIELLAEGVPGPASPLYCGNKDYWPACTSTAVIRPHPVRMAERRTREPVDHHFNCQSGYGSKPWFGDHPIGACPGATGDTDYVDELYSFTNGSSTPTGFQVYGDEASEPCTVDGGDIVIPEGNTVVACSPFVVKRSVTFTGGNVIFNGDVDITSSNGSLVINACAQEGVNSCVPGTDALSWSAGENYTESQYSSDAAWVAFRSGAGIKKDARAHLYVYDAAVFLDRDAAVTTSSGDRAIALSGGSGSLIWHAPRTGPFDVLAMWSNAAVKHDMGGQAALEMEGVYFAPVAQLEYRGSGLQDQVAAQLITEKLLVTGSGTLIVVPDINRSLTWFAPPESMLLR